VIAGIMVREERSGLNRRAFLGALGLASLSTPAMASSPTVAAVHERWYRLILELVRHTPIYSPPVASRAFAYLGVAAYEAVAGGRSELRSLAGQLRELAPPPSRDPALLYDEAALLHEALAAAAGDLFSHTGPTGQRAMAAMTEKTRAQVAAGKSEEVLAPSRALGAAIAAHLLAWARSDGGAGIANLGFPTAYALKEGPGHWVPTSTIALQQKPLLPAWGENRTFALADGGACSLPPPPAYSEDEGSDFYREAREVYDTTRKLTDEQRLIARFWSDDPMLSPTPPGHWIAIALAILGDRKAEIADRVDALARLSIAMADAFIACWRSKYEYDLLRPVTYIQRLIDPEWRTFLITPPFPEYPSGHSTQSGAAAAVLTAVFGENHAFSDPTHEKEGMPARPFASFWAAAEEAALSRLYGGIHFRSAIARGLDQGRCVGAHAAALRTRP
jgi:hypothetical protein